MTHDKAYLINLLTSGNSLVAARDLAGVEYHEFFTWLKEDKDFVKAYENALKNRATVLFETALDLGKSAVNQGKDEYSMTKLTIDTLKSAASLADPGRYGSKVEAMGEFAQGFIIETGIRRPGDEGYKEVPKPEVQNEEEARDPNPNGESDTGPE